MSIEWKVTLIALAPRCNCLMVLTTWTSLLKMSSTTLLLFGDDWADDDTEDDIDDGGLEVDMGVVKIGLLCR